jgi:tetratricopeptide (TPR) repeat protein
MALGEHYILGNGERSYQCAVKAISLADQSGMPNVIATALCGGILCCMGSTRLADGRILLNRARALVADQRLSGFQRLTLRFLITHYCAIGGDWVNWRFFREETENCEEAYLLEKGIFRDFFDLEDVDHHLLKGNLQAAEEVSVALLHRSAMFQKKHIHSLGLGQYALVLALNGKTAQAEEKITESFEIRKTVGGDTFKAFQYLYAGAAYACLGDVEKTRENLAGVVEMTKWILGEYSQGIVNLNLALALINAGRKDEAKPFIQELLDALAKLPIRHLITLHPGSISVLAEAVRLELRPPPKVEVIRELFGNSITPEGEVIPAMSVRSLGGLALSWKGTELGIESLTSVQRQLLINLLISPGFRVEKEILAARLWPDSSREKAVANFDMTLSRLRKSIDDLLGSKFSRHYLTVKN